MTAKAGHQKRQEAKSTAPEASPGAADLFASLVRLLEGLPGVSLKKSGTRASFLIGGKVFGFSRPLAFVLKLPKQRIEKLVTERHASSLVMGKRTMQEWVLIERKDTREDERNLALMKESIAFVSPT
jgi:hypothetical protein